MRRSWSVFAALASTIVGGAAAAQLRAAFYNVAGINGNHASLTQVLAAIHADDKNGFSLPADLLVFTEVRQVDVNALIGMVSAAAPPGVSYSFGTFTTSGSEDSSSGANAIFLRNGRVFEVPAGHLDIPTGVNRNTDRWLVRLTGYSSPLAQFYVYASHLKASPGSTNEQLRLAGVQAIRANADSLPSGTPILFCGDYNFYTAAEPGYQAFLEPGNGRGFDVLGPDDWLGAGNAWKHTQSPRDIGGGLAGGGMDDRFDISLFSGTMVDGAGLSFMSGCYRALGNDGMHYDLAINNGNNFYYPSQLSRSNALATNLFNASDHVPVIVDVQLPAVLESWIAAQPGKVVKNASIAVEVRTWNAAAAIVPAGADVLSFAATASGSVGGSASGTAPLAPNYESRFFGVLTSFVGPIAGTVTVTSPNEAVQNPVLPLAVTGQVVRPANGSFAPASDVDVTTVSYQVPVGRTPVQLVVPVHNFGYDANQALLDVDSVTLGPPGPGAAAFSVQAGTFFGIGASSAPVAFAFNPTGLAAGTYQRTATILTSDENIPGESSATLSLTLSVQVGTPTPGDLNGDGIVDGADLGLLLSMWGNSGGPADLNGDGHVNGADLGVILANWG